MLRAAAVFAVLLQAIYGFRGAKSELLSKVRLEAHKLLWGGSVHCPILYECMFV